MTRVPTSIRNAASAFLSIVALVSLAAQLWTLDRQVNVMIGLVLLVSVLLLAGWVTVEHLSWRYRAARAMPALARIRDLCTEYRVTPAGPDDIPWTAKLEEEVYSVRDAVQFEVLQEWYAANPTGFWILRARTGQRVGHFHVLPVKPATLATFAAGRIKERDIRGDSLFSTAERDQVRDVYIESIAITRKVRCASDAALLCLVSKTLVMIAGIADLSRLQRVYAMAASAPGENILRGLGFDEVGSPVDRADHHRMYSIETTILIANLRSICGDWLDETAATGA